MSLPLFFWFCFSFCFSRSGVLADARRPVERDEWDGWRKTARRSPPPAPPPNARQLFTERPRPRRNGAPPPLIELWRSCRQVVRASPSLVPWHSLCSTQLSVRATPIPWLQPARRDECSQRGSDRADLGVAVTHPTPQNNVEMARNSAGVGVGSRGLTGGATASVNQAMHRCCMYLFFFFFSRTPTDEVSRPYLLIRWLTWVTLCCTLYFLMQCITGVFQWLGSCWRLTVSPDNKKKVQKSANNKAERQKNLLASFSVQPLCHFTCSGQRFLFFIERFAPDSSGFINYKLCWCCKFWVQHLLLWPKNTNNYKAGVFSVKWPLTFKLNTLSGEVSSPLRVNRCLMTV